jgi:hypothetical protein
MMLRRLVLCVLVSVCCVVPARAGRVAYLFVEGSDGPDPGSVGALLLFESPPAETDAGWTISNVADIIEFSILDSKLAPVGDYTPTISSPSISSTTGATLDFGVLFGQMTPLGAVLATFDSSPGSSLLVNELTGVNSQGDWLFTGSLSVPEPSSLAMAASAATAGVMLWMRRRRRSHGETGPADINRH